MKQLTENEMTPASTLAHIQAQIKVPKSQVNQFGGYKYRKAEDILEAVKPIINPLGYWLTLTDEVVMIGTRFYVKATAILTNGINTYKSESLAREEESKKGMDGSQITGAASSYARKYALNGLLAIDDTKDADATNTHEDTWETEINGCKTMAELTELYNQNKAQVDRDERIKKLFANRKTQIK